MSEYINPGIQNKSGRALPLILSLLGLVLMGIVTAAAVRHNPLYSDHDAYGISTYRLIQNCKDQLAQPDNLPLTVQGQQMTLSNLVNRSKLLRAGEHLTVQPTASSSVLVSSVQHLDDGTIGLATPVMIAANSDHQQRILGGADMRCLFNRAKNAADVTLSIGGAPVSQ